MMKLAPVPNEVELRKSEQRLRIGWEDAHESVYPLRYLRGYCPCAACQGHGGTWNFVAVEEPTVTEIEEVGNYALKIVWDDGGKDIHTTGIYSYEVLRDLCPCDACQRAQGRTHPLRRMPANR